MADRTRSKRLTNAEIDSQVIAARAREKAAWNAGLRALSARYDTKNDRILVELSNGVAFAFPSKVVRGLKRATPAQRAKLELSPSGSGIIWDALDTDISVPGLLASTFRLAGIASALGSAGGSVTSRAKAKAARLNGSKGGRPRGKERR